MKSGTGPKNILILNLTRMGDLIQSTPLLTGLSRIYPDARLTLLVGSEFAEFAQRLPAVDERVVFDLKQFNSPVPDHPRSWVTIYRYIESVLDDLRHRQFDLVINLSHSKLSAFMIAYLGIPEIRGFCCNESGDRRTEHPWLQYFFIEPFNRAYNTFNLVDLFCRGGDIDPGGQPVQIESLPEDGIKAEAILHANGMDSSELLVGIQAGSSLEGRRWPAAKFARLADRLVDQFNARVLLFGVASESPLAAQITGAMKHPERALDLTGKTDISGLIGLVARCRYLVTNDTGTMHIAAALGIPIVGLFFAHAHPPETGPYSPGNVIFQANISCAPCSYGVECNNIVCIEKVQPELVADMMHLHASNGGWSLPENTEELSEVQIFQTEIDEDHCLRMRPLTRQSLTLTDVFAWAYRRLWLDTLMDSQAQPREDRIAELVSFLVQAYGAPENSLFGEVFGQKERVLNNLITAAGQGLNLVRTIIRQWETGGATASRIPVLAEEMTQLDDRINLSGLTHPEVKPLTDLFNKRKENIADADVLKMARATEACYRKLLQECEGLRVILERIHFALGDQAAWEEVDVSSMRMAVPGR